MPNSISDPFLNFQEINLKESSKLGTPFSNFNTKKLATDKILPKLRNTSIQSAQKLWEKEQRKKKFASTAGTVSGIGSTLDTFGNMIPNKTDDTTTNLVNTGVDTVANTLGSIPTPVTQAISGAMKIGSFIGKGMNQLIGMEKPKTGIDKVLSSNFMMSQPLGIVNALTKTKVAGSDTDLASIAQTYGGSDVVEGGEVGGISKAWSWLTGKRNKAKQLKSNVNRANLANIKKAAAVKAAQTESQSANLQGTYLNNQAQLQNLYNYNVLAAKKGTKLKLTILKNQVNKKDNTLEGVNLIPSGALHKELNHISDKLPEDVEITRKGIPVIVADEGGKLSNQVCEIEKDELVLHLQLTQKLEELKKQYDEGNEDALLETGKILTNEIIYNINDNTKLINQVV